MDMFQVKVRGIKMTIPLRPEEIPRAGFPMEGPAPDVHWEIVLDGGAFRVRARLNGKSYRKMLKNIDANSGNVSVVLQGNLSPIPKGVHQVLESAGFQVQLKTPKNDAVKSSDNNAVPTSTTAIVSAAPVSVKPLRVYVPSAQGGKKDSYNSPE